MMELTHRGHVIRAKALYDQEFFLAWGGLPQTYDDPWTIDTPDTNMPSFLTELKTTDCVRSAAVTDIVPEDARNELIKIYKVVQGTTQFSVGEHFNVGVQDGQPVIEWITDQNLVLPTEGSVYAIHGRYRQKNVTGLLREFGRQKITRKMFVVSDPQGELIAMNSRWSASPNNDPTPHVFIEFRFDHTAAAGENIYQFGIYTNSVPNADQPIGQMYFLPGTLAEDGDLYYGENVKPFPRIAGKSEINTFVITF